MTSEESWDVEQHKTEHECDEHWELRRKFLLAHKEKFPEDELICLAQVFTNVELLGCRYPKETMELIAELAQDIVADYREKQKSKLQRTFVKASDAASSKVKGTKNWLIAPKSASTIEESSGNCKRRKTSEKFNSKKEPPSEEAKGEQPFGNIVLVERPEDTPQNTLACAVAASGGSLEWKFDKLNDSCKCTIFIDSKKLAEASSSNQKSAKKEASLVGLRRLQNNYYTIKIKHNVSGEPAVTATSMLKEADKQQSIADDNIGNKLMKLMGWTGGGLGKSQQGITEPVTMKQQISREGIGLKSKSSSVNALKFKAKDVLTKYLTSDKRNDLVFSSDFSQEERATIHQVARQLGLKSHSYGPKDKRTLVVSRKISAQELVEELKTLGGATDKYELIKPTISWVT